MVYKRHWDGMANRDTKPIPAQKNTDYGLEEVCEAWDITDDTLFFVMESLYSLAVPNKDDDYSAYESSLKMVYVCLNDYIKYNLELWKPQYGETYYTPDPFRAKMYVMRKWINQPCDEDAYVRGIVFKTWREARDMCVKMTEYARRERRK